MPTQLDRLLESIHPRRTLIETARRADEALNSFPINRSQITDWDEFRDCVAAFYQHVLCGVLGITGTPELDRDFSEGLGLNVLIEAYGPNGEKAAFEMARTGTEGGLYAVLKKIARSIAHQYAQREISARVSSYVRSLSAAEEMAAADEYLGQYGHLLPSELTEGSAARLRGNLLELLIHHPQLLDQLGEIGRS